MTQPEQEPIAWMVYTQDGQSVYVTDNPTDIKEGQRALPLYTIPPNHEWVDLTDEQMEALEAWATDLEQGRQVWVPATTLRAAAEALAQPEQEPTENLDDLAVKSNNGKATMIYGYSNGKQYQLIRRKGMTGYLYVEGWRSPVWCTFERIEEIQ